jgi:hypothetical protein
MPKVKELIKDINYLSIEDKHYLYKKLKKDLLKDINISVVLDKYRGMTKNIWNMDAQKYINELRENDRV